MTSAAKGSVSIQAVKGQLRLQWRVEGIHTPDCWATLMSRADVVPLRISGASNKSA